MRSRLLCVFLLVASACTSARPPSPSLSPSPSGSAPMVTSTPRPSAPLRWRRLAAAPTPVEEVGCAVVGTTIVAAGGLLAGNHTARLVQIYDTATGTWRRGPDLPIALHHPSGVVFNGKAMIIGGFTQGDHGSARTFSLAGDHWIEGPRLEHPRGAAVAVAVGDRVVVTGGLSDGVHVAATEVYDGETWSQGAAIPTLRDHLAGASDGTSVYVAGGRRFGRSLDAFEAYDVAHDRWRRLPALPTARSGFGAIFDKTRVIAAGGELPGIYGNVEAFDVRTGRWSALPSMPTPRHGLCVGLVGRTMFTLLGGDKPGLAPSNVAEALGDL